MYNTRVRVRVRLMAICICLCSIARTTASTLQLLYDGIVSPQITQGHLKRNDKLSFAIPYSMVLGLSNSFMDDAIETFFLKKDPTMKASRHVSDDFFEERTLEIGQNCYEAKIPGQGGKCTFDHDTNEDALIHVTAHFYSRQNQVIVLQLEVSITSYSTYGRLVAKDALVQYVPKVNSHINKGNFEEVRWSIHERLNPLELTTNNALTVAASQKLADLKASSVDTLILSQPLLKNRSRISSDVSHNISLELWQYQDLTLTEPVKSLFLNGQLLTTSHPTGTAHAEALVHPALISSESPNYIVIVSLDPTAALKEILKHKSVQKVVVLGMDRAIIETTHKFMSHLDDCTFLGTGETSCLHQKIVEIADLDAKTWMKQSADIVLAAPDIDFYKGFIDIVYIDVPIDNDEWLAIDFHKNVHGSIGNRSVVVISAGSQPKLFEVEDNDLSPRDNFLRQAFRVAPHGLGYLLGSVYDEPLAKPLASAFLVLFPNGSDTYNSFVRTNSPAIEVDLIQKLHTNIAALPTLVYDGMTHKKYNTIARAWEHWYCKSLPGREMPICKSFLAKWFDVNNHFYGTEVRQHPVKGRSLFAIKDCPAGNFILPHDAGLSLRIDSEQWNALNKFIDDFPAADMYHQLRNFFIVYGFESFALGSTGWAGSIACNNTFMNHGCTDAEINTCWVKELYIGEDDIPSSPFSPPFLRKSELFVMLIHAEKNIKAGDEIMMDYMYIRENAATDTNFTKFLDDMCHKGVGWVPTTNNGTNENSYDHAGSHQELEVKAKGELFYFESPFGKAKT